MAILDVYGKPLEKNKVYVEGGTYFKIIDIIGKHRLLTYKALFCNANNLEVFNDQVQRRPIPLKNIDLEIDVLRRKANWLEKQVEKDVS